MIKYILCSLCGMISLCAISNACRCFTRHPQTNFCEANYAIKADILKEEVIGQFGGRRYRVKVLKNYKIKSNSPGKNVRNFYKIWMTADGQFPRDGSPWPMFEE
eukprot:XP_011413664.1 PREDICTED: metalloproteinase inhibitor 3-like [Crassostrea gigas]